MKKYTEAKFNIIKINAPDVICSSAIGPDEPVASERDNAYINAGKLFGGDFFIEF